MMEPRYTGPLERLRKARIGGMTGQWRDQDSQENRWKEEDAFHNQRGIGGSAVVARTTSLASASR